MLTEQPKEFVSRLEAEFGPAKELRFPPAPAFGSYRKWFPKAAVNHPAKASTKLIEFLIERYTKPGDSVLDPLAGSGSTGVLAALHGRDAVLVELEQKFFEWMNGVNCDGYSCHAVGCFERRKLEKLVAELTVRLQRVDEGEVEKKLVWTKEGQPDPQKSQKEAIELYNRFRELRETKARLESLPRSPHHFSGAKELVEASPTVLPKGSIRVIRGDARKLSALVCDADAVIASPPYGEEKNYHAYDGEKGFRSHDAHEPRNRVKRDYATSSDPANIGRLGFDSVDAVITSPPYANSTPQDRRGGVISPHMQGLISKLSGIPVAEFDNNYGRLVEAMKIARSKIVSPYGNSPGNIAGLKLGEVDAVITSPPYAQSSSRQDDREAFFERLARDPASKRYGRKSHPRTGAAYSQSKENIGNLPVKGVDAVITSPPYARSANGPDRSELYERMATDARAHGPDRFRKKPHPDSAKAYSDNKQNIGNLSFPTVDVAITSPPYGQTEAFQDPAFVAKVAKDQAPKYRVGKIRGHYRTSEAEARYLERVARGRVEDPANIGKLPVVEGVVDSVITSPPYEATISRKNGRQTPTKTSLRNMREYSGNPDNIGNAQRKDYMSAMKTVYKQMFEVVKPGGTAVIVIKAFVRDKWVVDLPWLTWQLLRSCGFVFEEVLKMRLPNPSFWRQLYAKKFPDVPRIVHEYVLVCRKGLE